MIDVVDTNAPTCHINDPDWPIRSEDQEDQGHSIDKSGNAGVQIQQVKHSQTNQVRQTETYSLRIEKSLINYWLLCYLFASTSLLETNLIC